MDKNSSTTTLVLNRITLQAATSRGNSLTQVTKKAISRIDKSFWGLRWSFPTLMVKKKITIKILICIYRDLYTVKEFKSTFI